MNKKKNFVSLRCMEDPEIRSLRVQTWFRAVRLASGKTPAQLEREFSQPRGVPRMLPRSCIWEKYARGEVVPRSGRRRDGALNLVERVEARYPGTKQWLEWPLWRLADKAPMTMSEIKTIYEELPEPIRSMFIATKNGACGIFWRRPIEIDHACEILLRYRGIHGLIAILAIVKEAEIIQNQYQHQVGIRAAMEYLRSVAVKASQPMADDIYAYLTKYIKFQWKSAGYFNVIAD